MFSYYLACFQQQCAALLICVDQLGFQMDFWILSSGTQLWDSFSHHQFFTLA